MSAKKYSKTLANLSSYTNARSCTDLTDCKNGIEEIIEYIDYKEKKGQKIPAKAYIKFYQLRKKEEKLRKK
jgi:hypothetical protein